MKFLSEEQLIFYQTRGFLKGLKVFQGEEVQEIQESYQHLSKKRMDTFLDKALGKKTEGPKNQCGQDHGKQTRCESIDPRSFGLLFCIHSGSFVLDNGELRGDFLFQGTFIHLHDSLPWQRTTRSILYPLQVQS